MYKPVSSYKISLSLEPVSLHHRQLTFEETAWERVFEWTDPKLLPPEWHNVSRLTQRQSIQ